MKKINTSWGKDASWYEDVITDEDSYQNKVILPNLIRMMNVKRGEKILDLGCGTGFFSDQICKAGGEVMGVDVGEELINIGRSKFPQIKFVVSSAENFSKEIPFPVDKVVMVLSLQNIENPIRVFSEIKKVLKKDGKVYLVLNHPAFRIPKESSWGWDGEKKVQYRRLDKYLSEYKAKIQMHPGENPDQVTWSFHRPLQFYFKIFNKNEMAVSRIEEWVSHRETKKGPRLEAENRARTEFPLFLALEVKNC